MSTLSYCFKNDDITLDDVKRLILASEPWISLNYTEAQVEELYKSFAQNKIIIAKEAEKVIGFILFSTGFLLGNYLKIIVVDHSYQGKGVGKGLMQEFEKQTFDKTPNAYLCVSDFNLSAQSFYKKIGYDVIGELQELLVPGKNEVFMRKTIGSLEQFKSRN